MTYDPQRQKLMDLLRRHDLTLAGASTAIGRNKTYLQQYVERRVPAVLQYGDSEKLAELLGCKGEDLRHAQIPKRKPVKRKPRPPAPAFPAHRRRRWPRWRSKPPPGRAPQVWSSLPKPRAGICRRT